MPVDARDVPGGYWEGVFRRDRDFFGTSASALARWALPTVLRDLPGRSLVELGTGNGRDLVYLAAHGLVVAGVDLSSTATREANRRRSELRGEVPPRGWVVTGDVDDYLRESPTRSCDIVYSNLVLTLITEAARLQGLLRECHRVLRDDGYLVCSVRSRSDAQYGTGVPVGRDAFDFAPDGPRIRFFTESDLREAIGDAFDIVATREATDGDPGFPLTLWLAIATPRRTLGNQKE